MSRLPGLHSGLSSSLDSLNSYPGDPSIMGSLLPIPRALMGHVANCCRLVCCHSPGLPFVSRIEQFIEPLHVQEGASIARLQAHMSSIMVCPKAV